MAILKNKTPKAPKAKKAQKPPPSQEEIIRRRRRNAVIYGIVMVIFIFVGLFNGSLQRLFYPQSYSLEVEIWAYEYEVDPLLVYAIIYTESGFDADAVSDAEAIGLMQMTSDTFDWLKPRVAPDEELIFQDLFTPNNAVRFGTYFYAMCLERYGGDVSTAAAAYHSGWTTVDELLVQPEYSEDGVTLTSFPYPQMQNYVAKINDNYAKYQDLYS